ncbi:MAG: HTH domain-containing protein, partial [Desulfuromonas sp.]
MADSGMRHAIVQLLLEAGDACLSGQQISSRLGISRAAVWKHIEALRH